MAQIFQFPRRKVQTLNEWFAADKARKLRASFSISSICAVLWLMLLTHRLESDPQHLVYIWIMGALCAWGAITLHLFAREILMETEWKWLAVGLPVFFSIALIMEVEPLRKVFCFLFGLIVSAINLVVNHF